MENWCYDAATVYGAGMAVHYETGEPLPRELFDKLCEQKTYQAGMGSAARPPLTPPLSALPAEAARRLPPRPR